MNFSSFISVFLKILTNKTVIITTVLVFLYIDFICYVARYRKKPPRPKVKRISAPAPAAAPAEGEGGEDGGGEESAEG